MAGDWETKKCRGANESNIKVIFPRQFCLSFLRLKLFLQGENRQQEFVNLHSPDLTQIGHVIKAKIIGKIVLLSYEGICWKATHVASMTVVLSICEMLLPWIILLVGKMIDKQTRTSISLHQLAQ